MLDILSVLIGGAIGWVLAVLYLRWTDRQSRACPTGWYVPRPRAYWTPCQTRRMTPEEEAGFDAAFVKFDEGFKGIDETFKRAPSSSG